MLMRSWFSVAELANMELPGMPATATGMRGFAERDGWFLAIGEGITWRPRERRGGGKEVHYSRLPPVALMALLIRSDCPPQRKDAPTC